MQCCVSFCKNTPDDVSPSARNRITFHGFPQDVRLRAAWLRALGKRDSHPPDCAVVCSQHFLDDDIFETENGLRQICTDAIPSTVQVCMICLDTDSKLFLMSKHKLEEAYEELIGHPVCDQGNLKKTLCLQCAQKLISFSRFRDKSLRARALMKDLVEKHELITRNRIKMISRTKHQLKSNFEVKMLGPDHCDLYILEDASEDKQTESLPSHFTTSLCSEATVQEVVVKNEETCDSPTGQDTEMSNVDTNNADHSSDEFVASNEDLLSDNSIMLETRLMDDALRKVLESNRAVAEQVAETMAPLKCESVPSECTLCSEEFVGEHACMQHMHMHGQNGDGDADCGTSQVCKPHTAVSSSHSSHLTENKQDIQRLNEDPRPSAGAAQTALAPLSARLATNTENNVQAEQADTIQKSVQAFDISSEQLLRQSSHNKSITDIRKLTNCFVKLYDVFKLPQKGVPIQEESHRKDTRTAVTGCDSQCQSVSQNENVRHTIEDNEPGTSKVKVNERNVCKTSKSEVNCSKDAKNRLTCDVCNDKFNRKSVLAKHIKSHTDIKPFACKFCQFKTKGRGNLITHVRTHTGDKPYGCELCKYKTFYKSILVSHMKTHTGEKPYSCELCEHKTARKYDLVLHMRTHTGEKPYTCDLCEYKCARKFHLVEHMRTHTGEKPYSCMLCKYKCIQKSYLVKHMRTHTGEKPYSCMLCKYKCIQKSYLASHMRIHTGEKPYSCTLCKYKCMQKSYLVSHMSTHTGKKPYSCMLCKYKCIQETNLMNHMRTHTGEKPYSCTVCKYKCIQKSYLVSHMRTHTGEKPYSCMLCKYKCSSSSNLAQHMRTHSGEKP